MWFVREREVAARLDESLVWDIVKRMINCRNVFNDVLRPENGGGSLAQQAPPLEVIAYEPDHSALRGPVRPKPGIRRQ